jgi:hypothetical protein
VIGRSGETAKPPASSRAAWHEEARATPAGSRASGDDPIDHLLVEASRILTRAARASSSFNREGEAWAAGEGLIVARLAYGEHDHD